MTTDDHIAAIKEHLKAIEAEKQPKKESKRYLVIPIEVDCDTLDSLAYREAMKINPCLPNCSCGVFNSIMLTAYEQIASKGKIITITEEQ